MKTAIALGTFDGLHRGHRAVIEKTLPFYSIAVTFRLPPKSVMGYNPELLILPDERISRLKLLGIKEVVMQDFESVRDIAAAEYLDSLKKKYNPARIVCGFNYRFGRGAQGDTKLLADFCKKNGIEFCCVPPESDGGQVVSSTLIREHIKSGNVKKAAECMYGGFSFEAPVIHGDKRGRTMGFPTANQRFPDMLVKPKFGVYISRVTIDGANYSAITNIGIRPTYKTESVNCETFINNFSGDIYGENIKTEILSFVREERKFDSIDQLKNAIQEDVSLLN